MLIQRELQLRSQRRGFGSMPGLRVSARLLHGRMADMTKPRPNRAGSRVPRMRARSQLVAMGRELPAQTRSLARPRPRSSVEPNFASAVTPLAPIAEPITLAPPDIPVRHPSGAIDWESEATQAAAAVLRPSKRISFGFPDRKSSLALGARSQSPAHYAGEMYRTQTGEVVVWTSDNCYLVSDPPLPGEPDFLARARITRAGCQ